jgi:hypothetical protein
MPANLLISAGFSTIVRVHPQAFVVLDHYHDTWDFQRRMDLGMASEQEGAASPREI